MSEIAEGLANLYMFRSVEARHLEVLVEQAPPVTYFTGDIVFHEGAAADTALLVVTGKLVAYLDPGGDRRILGDSRPGEIVGETALFTRGGTRNATVVAEGVTQCLELSRDTLTGVGRNPAMIALEQHMLGTMARRIRGTNKNIQRVWMEANAAKADVTLKPPLPTLRERLAGFFGGGS